MLEISLKANIMKNTDLRDWFFVNPCRLLSIITTAVTMCQTLHLNFHLIFTIISQEELININSILSEESNAQKG